MTNAEKELAKDRGGLMLDWIEDGHRACQLLYKAGATDEEVRIILDQFRVPARVDQEWVNAKRSWYAKTVEGL